MRKKMLLVKSAQTLFNDFILPSNLSPSVRHEYNFFFLAQDALAVQASEKLSKLQ